MPCRTDRRATAASDDTEREVEKYRQMLKDDPWSNPGLLDADRGEALWKEKRGPKGASLEQCDLGKGPGKVDGAFAELPRYFKDADRVMDLEVAPGVVHGERCRAFQRADIIKRPYSKANQAGTELEALATYVANKSNGLKFTPQLAHAKEKRGAGPRRGPVLPAPGPDGFLVLHLPRRHRQAHPPAGAALPRQAGGGAHR